MSLGLREIRRMWGRFVLLAGAVALLVFLILFQQSIQNGLITAFIGAVRNQTAPVIVYSLEGQRTLQASFLSMDQVEKIEAVDGIARTARVQQSTYTVEVSDSDVTDASVVGTSDPELFMPSALSSGRMPSTSGEAVGSSGDFRIGDQVRIEPSPRGTTTSLKVVGLADDVQLNVTATLFTDIDTASAVAKAHNPQTPGDITNAVAVQPNEGTTASTAAAAIESSVSDVEALTRAEAADRSPGVAQVRQSFQVIFLLYALVVPLVTGLFFLILTLQKAGALTLLRAMGAQPGFLARSLLLQVGLVMVVGIVIGVAMFFPLSQQNLGGISLSFDVAAVLTWATILIVLGLVSSLASLRRVMKIDPIKAATGGVDI
ncbi:MAG: FtsX-like permease family protein [Microthrixaceae bacterium]